MNRLTNDKKKSIRLLPYLPFHYMNKLWSNIKTITSRLWMTISYVYFTFALWFMERFITCDYPLGHKNYGKIYKAKMKLEYREHYTGNDRNYNTFFNQFWSASTINPTINKNMLSILMKSNLLMMGDSPLKTLCGIQPLIGPVGLVYKLRYSYAPPAPTPENKETMDGKAFLEGSGGRKMMLEVLSDSVEAKTKRLDSSWSLEAQQDLNAVHGIDLGEELTKAIVSVTNAEHLDEFIKLLIDNCENKVLSHNWIRPESSYPMASDAFSIIGCGINAAASDIARLTRRGSGNVLWVNPITLSNMQIYLTGKSGPFVQSKSAAPFLGDPTGVNYVGTLNHSIKVYCVMLPEGIDAIMGYKGGNGESDAGYFHAPYIPLVSTGVRMNETTTLPEIGFMSRYGSSMGVVDDGLGDWRDYYKTITINFNPEDYTDPAPELLQE